MRRRPTAIAVLAGFLMMIGGCGAIPQEHSGAAKGAGIGAATGAAAGVLLGGDNLEGAVIGGLAGALIGGAVGHYTVDRERDAQQTAQKYDYSPSEGTRVQIETATTQPDTVRPGEKVELQSTYALMTPETTRPVTITESYEIRHNGELVGSPQMTVTHEAGTYQSSVPLFLPENADEGTYQVVTTVRTNGAQDRRETSFEVR